MLTFFSSTKPPHHFFSSFATVEMASIISPDSNRSFPHLLQTQAMQNILKLAAIPEVRRTSNCQIARPGQFSEE
jgi:hypothetical protein